MDEKDLIGKKIKDVKVNGFEVIILTEDGIALNYEASDGGYSCYEILQNVRNIKDIGITMQKGVKNGSSHYYSRYRSRSAYQCRYRMGYYLGTCKNRYHHNLWLDGCLFLASRDSIHPRSYDTKSYFSVKKRGLNPLFLIRRVTSKNNS